MSSYKRIAPIFPVRNLEESLAHYARFGFETRAYEAGDYGFVTAGDVEIHLGVVTNVDQHTRASAYLFVDDANAIAARWKAAGLAVHGPVDTQWGQREGVIIDPDGNIIRFGSPMA